MVEDRLSTLEARVKNLEEDVALLKRHLFVVG